VSKEDANFFSEGLRRGGVLVVVHARTDEQAARAEAAMKRNGAIAVEERRDEWLRSGWNGRVEEKAAREEPALPLAAVCTYEIVIAMPA
jgi:hypothetical protein